MIVAVVLLVFVLVVAAAVYAVAVAVAVVVVVTVAVLKLVVNSHIFCLLYLKVSLYQQQRRVRLSIPISEQNNDDVDVGGKRSHVPPAAELWSDPSARSNIFKRRSAVSGLSPNTGMSIGAVM